MAFATTAARPDNGRLAAAALGLAVVGVAWGIVHLPWLVTGAVLGLTVLALALTAPLLLVAIMLMTGPINLSFMTGGFKSLFPQMGGLDMNGIRLMGATAGFLAYIMFEPRARAAATGPLARVWILFLIFAGATLSMSLDRMEGVRLLLKLAYPLLTFLIVVGVADTRERAYLLMKWTLIGALILTVVVNPILVLNGGYRVALDGFIRVGGLGKGDNPFAFYCTIILLMVFTRFLLRMEVKYLLFSVVLVAWIALTVTRIAALASVVGLTTIGVLVGLSTGNRKALVGTGVLVAIVGAVLFPNVLVRTFGYAPSPADLLRIVSDPLTLFNSINWQGRELLWAILWTAFMASPIIGRGLGSSAAVIREGFPDQSVKVAHNEYMRLATDTGVLGVALFAIAVWAWLIPAFRMSRRGDQQVREFAIPAVAGILVWAVIAITDNAFDSYTDFTQYVGFLMACAVVAQAHRPDSAEAL